MFFKRKFLVNPTTVGYLYRKNRLHQKLSPGIYEFTDRKKYYALVCIPTAPHLAQIINQEVLTKDNIALRFSFIATYFIADTDRFIEKFDVLSDYFSPINEANMLVHNYSQIHIRQKISQIASEELNDKKSNLLEDIPAELQAKLGEYGIAVSHLMLRDVTFPKAIQQLFARRLEAKINAQSDLENARTAVATARTLKNASQLMKNDDNIRFIQFMEILTKISTKGNHTFVLGDLQEPLRPQNTK